MDFPIFIFDLSDQETKKQAYITAKFMHALPKLKINSNAGKDGFPITWLNMNPNRRDKPIGITVHASGFAFSIITDKT